MQWNSVSQRETQCGKVRQCQTNVMKSMFDSVSRFATMLDAERQHLILCNDIWFYLLYFFCVKNSKRSCPFILFSICSFILSSINFPVFDRWTFIFNLFAPDWNISTMVSCHFSERHFTLIHSHKLSNRIYLLHELSLFIFSILHPFSAKDWLLEKTFISELRKTRACRNTSSVCCNGPYIRIYWNVIQLFTLNKFVNGEFHSLILSIPYRW